MSSPAKQIRSELPFVVSANPRAPATDEGVRQLVCESSDGHQRLVHAEGLDFFLSFTRPPYGSGQSSLALADRVRELAKKFRASGPSCFATVEEPFLAIAFDSKSGRLTMARDLAGRSSMYYVERDGEVIISNSLPRLVSQARVKPDLSQAAVDFYWGFGFIPAPYCILENVRKVPPGTAVEISQGVIQSSSFLPLPMAPDSCNTADSEIIDELERRLSRSLEAVTSGANRVCMLLSGGLDSSLLAQLMKQRDRTDITTASIVSGIDDPNDRADKIAACLGFKHRSIDLPPFSVERLAQILTHCDEPFADTMSFPLAHLLEQVSGSNDVCISGIGADSLFCGLNSHLALDQHARGYEMPESAKRQLGPRAAASVACDLDALRSAPSPLIGWAHMFTTMSADQHAALTGDRRHQEAFQESLSGFVRTWHGSGECSADRLVRFDAEVPMADSTLQLVRQIAKFVGVFHDTPFLTADLYSFARQLPRNRLIRSGVGKMPLRQLLARRLPSDLWQLPKIGFRLPLVAVLEDNRATVAEVLASVQSASVSQSVVDEWTRDFFDGRQRGSFFAARRIWKVLIWELWCRAHATKSH